MPNLPSGSDEAEAFRTGTFIEDEDEIRLALPPADRPALSREPNVSAGVSAKGAAKGAAAKPVSAAQRYRPTHRPSAALLTICDDGRDDGETIRLRADRFIIGRTEGDLLIPHDRHISARHIEITRQNVGGKARWVVTDLQSTHGLFVRVRRTVLADRAEFLVGRGRYRFELQEGSAGTVDYTPAGSCDGTRNWSTESTATRATLMELIGGALGDRIALTRPEYWIGSDPACALCRADDPFIEPRHLRLSRDDRGRWHAEHDQTLNGLWLKMTQITVDATCQFQIGEQRFRLKTGG